MKVQMKYPAIALCVAMLAAGCSQGEAMSTLAGDKHTQVPLKITSADLQAETTVTRTFTALGSGASIGVFLRNAPGGSSYTQRNNVRYNCESEIWNPVTEDARIYLTSADANVCAYYPYQSSVTDATQVLLVPHILAADEVPLAYAVSQKVNVPDMNVTFSMRQAYSWLVLDFKRGNAKDDITLSEFSLNNSGLYKESVINITNGIDVTNTPADGGMITFAGDIALAKNNSVTRNLFMPPSSSLVGGLKVSVKVKEYGNKVLSTTLAGLTALERGYKYAVTLTVDGTVLGVTSVEVLPWAESTINNGGNPFVPLP